MQLREASRGVRSPVPRARGPERRRIDRNEPFRSPSWARRRLHPPGRDDCLHASCLGPMSRQLAPPHPVLSRCRPGAALGTIQAYSSHPVANAWIAGEGMGGLAVEGAQPPQPLVEGEVGEPGRSCGRVQPFVAEHLFHPAEHEVKLAFVVRQTGRHPLHGGHRVSPHLGAVPETDIERVMRYKLPNSDEPRQRLSNLGQSCHAVGVLGLADMAQRATSPWDSSMTRQADRHRHAARNDTGVPHVLSD